MQPSPAKQNKSSSTVIFGMVKLPPSVPEPTPPFPMPPVHLLLQKLS